MPARRWPSITLQAAFDLERMHAGGAQLIQIIAHADITRRQPRAVLPLPIIIHAARLGAASAVAAAAADQSGIAALAGHAHALRAVNEHFGFNAGGRRFADGLQRAFARQHGAGNAKRLQKARA